MSAVGGTPRSGGADSWPRSIDAGTGSWAAREGTLAMAMLMVPARRPSMEPLPVRTARARASLPGGRRGAGLFSWGTREELRAARGHPPAPSLPY